ncbi:MAG TPA: PhzF family phenazine biosynthesis protein, partial [Phytomonospora sp.]
MTAAPTIVAACLRDERAGNGGSPTAVLRETPMSDRERRRIPVTAGTSHVVFVDGDGTLRFFTAEGELPACGHGTVAALAWLGDFDGTLRTANRVFAARAVRRGEYVEAAFDAGPVDLRDPTGA